VPAVTVKRHPLGAKLLSQGEPAKDSASNSRTWKGKAEFPNGQFDLPRSQCRPLLIVFLKERGVLLRIIQ